MASDDDGQLCVAEIGPLLRASVLRLDAEGRIVCAEALHGLRVPEAHEPLAGYVADEDAAVATALLASAAQSPAMVVDGDLTLPVADGFRLDEVRICTRPSKAGYVLWAAPFEKARLRDLVDASAVQALVEDTDASLVVDLLRMFEEHLPERLVALERSEHGVAAAAHTLGSAALQLGAIRLGEACRDIEARADRVRPEEVAALVVLARRTLRAMRVVARRLAASAR